jgi:hypothetical protein
LRWHLHAILGHTKTTAALMHMHIASSYGFKRTGHAGSSSSRFDDFFRGLFFYAKKYGIPRVIFTTFMSIFIGE